MCSCEAHEKGPIKKTLGKRGRFYGLMEGKSVMWGSQFTTEGLEVTAKVTVVIDPS